MKERPLFQCLLLLLLVSLFPTLIQAPDPVVFDDEDFFLRFEFHFGFFDDDLVPATITEAQLADDMDGLLCQTQYFFSGLLQNHTQSQSIHAKALDIDWTVDETLLEEFPVNVSFTVQLIDSKFVWPLNDFYHEDILLRQMAQLEYEELQNFVEQYVWKAGEYSIFQHVERMGFHIEITPLNPQLFAQGVLPAATCPETLAPTMAPTESFPPTFAWQHILPMDVETANATVLRFHFRFGFFEDAPVIDDIPKRDIVGVICQTQTYLSRMVRSATHRWTLHAYATQIDWAYHPEDHLSAQLNFTVHFDDSIPNADPVDDAILIKEMNQLGEAGLKQFVTQWIWKSDPYGDNHFAHASHMAYDAMLLAHPVRGEIAEVKCPNCDNY